MSEVKARANALLEEAAATSLAEIGDTLRALGLSGYATEAFCALARMVEATAGVLVTRTGIPDSKIYYALDELADKGLIEVQAGKPKTYRAIPAQEAEARLARLIESKFEKERAAVKRVVSLLEPLRAGDPVAVDVGADQLSSLARLADHLPDRLDPTVFGELVGHQGCVVPGVKLANRIGIAGYPVAEVRPADAPEVLAGGRRQELRPQGVQVGRQIRVDVNQFRNRDGAVQDVDKPWPWFTEVQDREPSSSSDLRDPDG